MKRRIAPIMVILVLALGMSAYQCQDFEKNTYRALLIMGHSYDAGMRSIAELYEQGFVDNEQLDTILAIADKYYVAYHIAVEALEGYSNTRKAEDKDRLRVALEEVLELFSDLAEIINPIITAHGMKKMEL